MKNKKKKCKYPHGWVYLNKKFDDKELTIVAFCDYCEYIDEKALKLQKEVDKANRSFDEYKAESMRTSGIFYSMPSKMKN